MTTNPIKWAKRVAEDNPWAFVLGVTGIVTLIRLIVLAFAQTDLGPDEAQYWFWGQTLDWGYYSKPPMIAWVIALPTRLLGDYEFSVRLLSPILIGGAGLLLFQIAQRLYNDKIALWTVFLWTTMPVVIFGATLMSTDIPLLFFWSLALFGLVAVAQAVDDMGVYRAGAILGAGMGFGFLSKYAMIYFLIGWVLALIWSPFARRTLRAKALVPAFGLAALIFTPNLIWNAKNGFQTLSHTADNANWGADLLNPDEFFEFFSAQFGVLGPILFGALLFGIGMTFLKRDWRRSANGKDVFLLSFILPPLLIICMQALLSRAHANWAVAAYPAAMVLLPVWLIRVRAKWVLWGSLGLHSVVGILFSVLVLNFALADKIGFSNEIKRLRGWDETMAQLRVAVDGLDGIIVDERENAAHLIWLMRDDPIPLQVFDLNGRADNTYEHEFPFVPNPQGQYLLATQTPQYLCAYKGFAVIEPMGTSFVDLHAKRRGVPERTINLYRLAEYSVEVAGPLGTRCP